jgi:mannose-6-phosphate isomerase-like protein (cupin superfamily)
MLAVKNSMKRFCARSSAATMRAGEPLAERKGTSWLITCALPTIVPPETFWANTWLKQPLIVSGWNNHFSADSILTEAFTKGKFAVPISHENVKQDWAARGYSNPRTESYPQGWSRGEHTHPVSLIMTLLTGRMEFTFGAQHFVLEPGDELFYPANTAHSAKNISDSVTQMMSSDK